MFLVVLDVQINILGKILSVIMVLEQMSGYILLQYLSDLMVFT